MIKQTEKGKNAPYTIYHHTVIILILTIITVLQSLTEIHSYLNFDLINKELAQKNMILQHFRFYPSFTLFIIKTCNYFTILEIRGERKLFFSSPDFLYILWSVTFMYFTRIAHVLKQTENDLNYTTQNNTFKKFSLCMI